MAAEYVVTPGGYRPPEMVHKIGGDLKLRILTGRLQGFDASDTAVADYGSVPRDGGNPALTPGYALPPGEETPEGSELAPSMGRGWIAFAHWTNEGSEHISSFRSTWRVPPEPASRNGQTIFLFSAMQDPIPMTLLPALQWGPSAAGGGEYWSVASWYIGGTTGAVFHGELVPVSVEDELTGVIRLAGRQRAHCDYRSGFEEFPEADLPVFHARDLSRCGVVMAAYGIKQCSDYPDANALGFRNIEVMTGFRRPALAWNPVNTITDCGQHVFVLSDANPGGQVDVHFRQVPETPAVEPVAAEAVPEEVAAEPSVAAAIDEDLEPVAAAAASTAESETALEAEPELEPVVEEVPEAIEPEPIAAAAAEAAPEIAVAETEPAEEPVMAEAAEAAPEEEAPEPLAAVEPETVATTAGVLEPAAAAAETEAPSLRLEVTESAAPVPSLEVHPRIDRLVEITIHNHSPAGPTSADLESRLARLEATMTSFAQLLAPLARPQPSADVDGDVAAKLERLVQMKSSGALTDDEFAAVKSQVIGGPMSSNGANVASKAVLP
jgi:hypothetical protein